MTGQLVLDQDAIGELCRRYGVRRLVLFGSAVTDRFDPSRSDVDFLVESGTRPADGSRPTSASEKDSKCSWDIPSTSLLPRPWRTRTSQPRWRRADGNSMQPETPALLWHARPAAGLTLDFVSRRNFQEYEHDPMLKSAVERSSKSSAKPSISSAGSISPPLTECQTCPGSSPSAMSLSTATRLSTMRWCGRSLPRGSMRWSPPWISCWRRLPSCEFQALDLRGRM